MRKSLSRREMLALTSAAILGFTASESARGSESVPQSRDEPLFALNTGTLMGFNLPIEEEIAIAAKAGYGGIEVWMFKIQQFLEKGRKIGELKKILEDHRISVLNAISFPSWIVDDEKKRSEGLEQMKKEMNILAELGCPYIAAPPSGATSQRLGDLEECGKRYGKILKLGESVGVVPLLELWGASATLSRLSDGVAVAVAAAHPNASLLLDAYHLYRGGNDFASLKQISGKSLKVFHLNDYPADPPREKLVDADRVYPGDGICPITRIVHTLQESGFTGALSLELFNKTYWESGDPLSVAKTGLEKMKTTVEKSKQQPE